MNQIDPTLRSGPSQRLLALEMYHQMPAEQEDPDVRDRLVNNIEAQEAILALLVRAYKECGGHTPRNAPTRFQLATMALFDELSETGRFILDLREMDRLIELDHATLADQYGALAQYVTVTRLHRTYIDWHKQHYHSRNDALPIRKFNAELRSMGWETAKSSDLRWLGKILKDDLATLAGSYTL